MLSRLQAISVEVDRNIAIVARVVVVLKEQCYRDCLTAALLGHNAPFPPLTHPTPDI